MYYKYLLFFIAIIIFSCQSNSSQQDDLNTYFKHRGGGWKSRNIKHYSNEIAYKAVEVPIEYYLLKNRVEINTVTMDSLLIMMSDERVIEFEITFEGEKEYNRLNKKLLKGSEGVQYISSGIKKDFQVLTSQGDTINCKGVHFERHFEVDPKIRLLLYFDNVHDDYIQLLYDDQLYKNGLFKFKFGEIPVKMY
ncbi:hypothetical protein SAMN04488096_10443 [Mesonia phycicola]|uniref:Uncharacterized protein n=1 Tax=Mesonia phycicola TaxID=579105 RepID=A0A1M6DKZ8_9FLAO|nr:hypothetical protein [Mesonia phycicola]SHI73648.1 hypothetical protein SAMN04488096_10443 [Mesonia phycicola]